MQKIRKKINHIFLMPAVFATAFLAFPFFANAAPLVPCATKASPTACTLCDLIVGLQNIMDWGLKVAIVVGIFVITIAGIMYMVSAGDSGLTTLAKGAIKNVAVGLIIMLSAWLIINYTMIILGANTDLGIGVLSDNWMNLNFTCN